MPPRFSWRPIKQGLWQLESNQKQGLRFGPQHYSPRDDGADMTNNQDIIDLHIVHLKYLNRRPTSVRQRQLALLHLERMNPGRPLLELDGEALQAFVQRKSLGSEARAGAVSHMRGFYRWALDESFITVDPSHRLRRPKREHRIPRPMPDKAAGRALDAAPDPIRQWLWLAAYSGLRCCEIAQVRGSDFLIRQTPPILVIRESKGGDPSVVPIAEPLMPVARELEEMGSEWCFPKGRGGTGHITAGQLQKRGNAFLHDLGVPETMHQLRHWYGTQTYKVTGRDLRSTQELMRHRSPVSTSLYTHVDMGESARALNDLPILTRKIA